MPTDNPKISAYVPPAIYDRFIIFQREQKLSMSQAAIVIFAEYFGMQETIKETTQGTSIGGVTLDEFINLKKQFSEFRDKVEHYISTSSLLATKSLEDSTNEDNGSNSSKSVNEPESNTEEVLNVVGEAFPLDDSSTATENELLSKLSSIPPLSVKQLARRFQLKSHQSVTNTSNLKKGNAFLRWSSSKDPDSISWRRVEGNCYVPSDRTTPLDLEKLRIWLTQNMES